MATPGGVRAAPVTGPGGPTVADRLFRESYRFNFFQAVRLLARLADEDRPGEAQSGARAAPRTAPCHFTAHLSLGFPVHHIDSISAPAPASAPAAGDTQSLPAVSVNFMGLTGPSGILPHHYTQLLLRLERQDQRSEARALRHWFDLFNHRMIHLFFLAWEKYRVLFDLERGGADLFEPGRLGGNLLSLIGLGTGGEGAVGDGGGGGGGLRDRLVVSVQRDLADSAPTSVGIRDFALIRSAGMLAQRPRSAVNLQALARRLFGVPVTVHQFQGNWLGLEPPSQTRLGVRDGNAGLGQTAVVGERVWSVENKVRLRLGPLGRTAFDDYLPSEGGTGSFGAFCRLVRFYLGAHLDFDVQLVLRAAQVPQCQLATDVEQGSRLGWNSWLGPLCASADRDDAVFVEEGAT